MYKLNSLLGIVSKPPSKEAFVLGEKFENTEEWDPKLIERVKSCVRFTYRAQFKEPIMKHELGPSPLASNVSLVFRSLPSLDLSTSASNLAALGLNSFSTDAGWGCMIRSAQSLLANAMLKLDEFSIDQVLSLFLDCSSHCNNGNNGNSDHNGNIEGSFSLHNFVEFASSRGEKYAGEWFGPSNVANFIEADFKFFRVYKSEGNFIDEVQVLQGEFPLLILSGLRLGIDRINKLYYNALKLLLQVKQTVGIAGGRVSASHYFYGLCGDYLLFHDPHETQVALTSITTESKLSVQSDKINMLHLDDMDPSFLGGVLLTSGEDYMLFKRSMNSLPAKERIFSFGMKPGVVKEENLNDENLNDDGYLDISM